MEAMKLARAATFAAPDDAEAGCSVARIALAQDNPAEALRVLDHAPASGPLAWSAGLVRATALEDEDRFDDAVALLEDMATREPTRPDALGRPGRCPARSRAIRGGGTGLYPGDRQAAEDRKPPLAPVLRTRHRLRAYQALAAGRGRLLKALELEPEQPFVLNYLGYSWVDQGLNLDRAKAMLNRAVELRPDDGFIVDSLGWAYFRLGEHDKAVTYLERAVELEPGDPVINDHLGDAYWRVGRNREARFQWQRALTFEPERRRGAADPGQAGPRPDRCAAAAPG